MPKKATKVDEEIIVVSNEESEVEETEEEVITVSKETEDKAKEAKDEDEIQIVPVTNAPIERNVKIMVKEQTRCNIGGVWYDFAPEKQYNVPENVKTILRDAGKLAPM